MNKRKLLIGIGILLIIVGGLLAAFAPGGWLNRGAEANIVTPIGTISARESPRTSVGSIVGYCLLTAGGLVLVIGFAIKSTSNP